MRDRGLFKDIFWIAWGKPWPSVRVVNVLARIRARFLQYMTQAHHRCDGSLVFRERELHTFRNYSCPAALLLSVQLVTTKSFLVSKVINLDFITSNELTTWIKTCSTSQ